MIKLAKNKESEKSSDEVGSAYLALMGSLSVLYSNFSLIIGKTIL